VLDDPGHAGYGCTSINQTSASGCVERRTDRVRLEEPTYLWTVTKRLADFVSPSASVTTTSSFTRTRLRRSSGARLNSSSYAATVRVPPVAEPTDRIPRISPAPLRS
jgi:hypothetical protein